MAFFGVLWEGVPENLQMVPTQTCTVGQLQSFEGELFVTGCLVMVFDNLK